MTVEMQKGFTSQPQPQCEQVDVAGQESRYNPISDRILQAATHHDHCRNRHMKQVRKNGRWCFCVGDLCTSDTVARRNVTDPVFDQDSEVLLRVWHRERGRPEPEDVGLYTR